MNVKQNGWGCSSVEFLLQIHEVLGWIPITAKTKILLTGSTYDSFYSLEFLWLYFCGLLFLRVLAQRILLQVSGYFCVLNVVCEMTYWNNVQRVILSLAGELPRR